jgi:hypothetical protein
MKYVARRGREVGDAHGDMGDMLISHVSIYIGIIFYFLEISLAPNSTKWFKSLYALYMFLSRS